MGTIGILRIHFLSARVAWWSCEWSLEPIIKTSLEIQMRQLASLTLTLSFSLLLLPSIPPSLSLTLTSMFRSVSQHFSLSFKISLSIFLHQIITRHVRYTSVLLIQAFFIRLPLPPTPISPSLCLPLFSAHLLSLPLPLKHFSFSC